jgi:hypothetical protein
MRARDLIERFGNEEEAFLKTEFLAPVVRGAGVRVRIAGIVCELAARARQEGIFVLRPKSHREAAPVRPATRAEAKRYLELFPRARLVAALLHGERWFGLPAGAAEKGVRVEGLVPIAIAPNLQLFQTASVRFDGALFLLEGTERPAEAAYLRDELGRGTPVEALSRKGLVDAERAAYARALELKREMEQSADERRLDRALKLAGAELESYHDQQGSYVVSYRVDGRPYTSVVAKGDLSVLSAGVCLSGRDRDFDLATLVGVLRQHRRLGRTQ